MKDDDMSASQAKDALKSIHYTQQELLNEYIPPVWLRFLMAFSFGSIIFGYGMTEHENMWALAIWVGAICFGLSTALYVYFYRLKGIKIACIPRSKVSEKINFISVIIFAFLCSGSRFLRTELGFEFAPYVCSISAAVIFFWLQAKYPTGEVEVEKSK